MTIATIISFCTNDYRFLAKSIAEAKTFSKQILIAVCDHFFDGQKEDRELLDQCYEEHPDCEFIEFAFLHDQTYSPFTLRNSENRDWIRLWHSTSRYVPFFYVQKECDYLLFLDADEILESSKFNAWLKTKSYLNYDLMRLGGYYYFREACYRSQKVQNTGLFVKKTALQASFILNSNERLGIFERVEGKKATFVNGLDNQPMIHHYSGVKTKEEWLKKTQSWGHHWEDNWKALIEEEFSHPFAGKDFTYGDTYEQVTPFFDPLSIKIKRKTIARNVFLNVRKVNHKEIQRKEIEHTFL